jgi:hypothetical protein
VVAAQNDSLGSLKGVIVPMKRPFAVTLFSLLVLLFAAWNIFQVFSTWQSYDLMRTLGLTTEANLLIVIGLTWAIGFGLAAWGLWRLQSWGRTWMLIAIVAYQAQHWVMRLALMRSPDEVVRRPADVFLSLLSIVVVWGFLFIPKIRRLYVKSDK